MTRISEARTFVGTTPLSGLAQFALLQQVWFDPRRGVLEIGCGALHLAKPLLALPGVRYVGVDPNRWLREVAMEHDPTLGALCLGGIFSSRDDFRGWPWTKPANIAFAHSVLTHISQAQLEPFFVALLDQADRALVSVNLDAATTAHATDWSYPDSVAFAPHELFDAVYAAGWRTAAVRPDLRAFYMDYCPGEPHRWLYVSR